MALAILAALLLTLCACGKVRQAEEAIDAIGNVTAESGAQIEAAEAAVEALNDKQRDKLPNLTVLEEAQTEYETVLEEQAVTEACVQEAENAIDAIGSVTLDSGDAIRAARAAYDLSLIHISRDACDESWCSDLPCHFRASHQTRCVPQESVHPLPDAVVCFHPGFRRFYAALCAGAWETAAHTISQTAPLRAEGRSARRPAASPQCAEKPFLIC